MIYRVTNGVPRGLYSRVAVTPLASSPWPAHAIYLSRLRDSSPLSFFLALSLFFSPASVQRSVAASARLQHSCSETLPRSTFEVDVSSGHIFVTSESRGSNLPRKRFKLIYGNICDRSSRRFCSNLNQISNYPAETSIISNIIPLRSSVGLSIRRVDNMFRVSAP